MEFTIDLPKGRDGKRRQMRRRGFKTEKLAERAEREARTQFGTVEASRSRERRSDTSTARSRRP
ncbi:Arm DNA-binding domain-containing protein [Micromonospora sp. NBC_01405]|uniref:Arm DNA-binding domain-containing protein n=1 Tax=Micromonospora sp. NBC_01405 TaxID=2903589 RepID=UPI003245A99D